MGYGKKVNIISKRDAGAIVSIPIKGRKLTTKYDKFVNRFRDINLGKIIDDKVKQRIEAKTEKQASYVELFYQCSLKTPSEVIMYADGLVRYISFEYTGSFEGYLSFHLLGAKIIVGRKKVIISFKNKPKNLDGQVLFTFSGRFKINKGVFIDYHGNRKNIHLLTENRKVLKQILGGRDKLLDSLRWRGSINFISPSGRSYNFLGDTWNKRGDTFGTCENLYNQLAEHFERDLVRVKSVFKKSKLNYCINSNVRHKNNANYKIMVRDNPLFGKNNMIKPKRVSKLRQNFERPLKGKTILRKQEKNIQHDDIQNYPSPPPVVMPKQEDFEL